MPGHGGLSPPRLAGGECTVLTNVGDGVEDRLHVRGADHFGLPLDPLCLAFDEGGQVPIRILGGLVDGALDPELDPDPLRHLPADQVRVERVNVVAQLPEGCVGTEPSDRETGQLDGAPEPARLDEHRGIGDLLETLGRTPGRPHEAFRRGENDIGELCRVGCIHECSKLRRATYRWFRLHFHAPCLTKTEIRHLRSLKEH